MAINKLEIVQKLPNNFRSQALELLYEAFQIKISALIKDKEKALRIIPKAINYEAGFYAIYENKLVGMAGIQSKGNKYFKVKFSTLLKEFNFFSALWKHVRFKLESLSAIKEDELEIVALSVQNEMRGKKIGGRIIDEIIKYAKENGFKGLTLTVVDTNQGAKRLYERFGFAVTKIKRYGFLTRSAGFESVIHMYKNINLEKQ